MPAKLATKSPIPLAATLVLALGPGCAHRRQAYDSHDLAASPGVHVRAPFVNVQVRGSKRVRQEPKLSRIEDDEKDEKKVSHRTDEDDDRD